MIKLTKGLFKRLMREAYDLGKNDGTAINFEELLEAYLRELEGR